MKFIYMDLFRQCSRTEREVLANKGILSSPGRGGIKPTELSWTQEPPRTDLFIHMIGSHSRRARGMLALTYGTYGIPNIGRLSVGIPVEIAVAKFDASNFESAPAGNLGQILPDAAPSVLNSLTFCALSKFALVHKNSIYCSTLHPVFTCTLEAQHIFTMFSSNKSMKPTSRSKTSSAVRDGRMSFESDASTLLNVALPLSSAKTLPKFDHIVEVEMMDEEDRAWGPPPSSGLKWSLPRFSRKSRSS